MSPFLVNVLPLILVITGIVLRYSGYPDIIGFLLVTAGFSILVIKKWLDKSAPTALKYLYTGFLIFYIYLFVSA